jgi:hypothetical protein
VPQAGAVLRDGRVIQRGRHAELTELDAQVRRALHPPGSRRPSSSLISRTRSRSVTGPVLGHQPRGGSPAGQAERATALAGLVLVGLDQGVQDPAEFVKIAHIECSAC